MLFSKKRKLKKSTPEEYEQFAKNLDDLKVGFKDRLAMVVAAFLVIVLPCFLILLVISGIAMLLFGGFN